MHRFTNFLHQRDIFLSTKIHDGFPHGDVIYVLRGHCLELYVKVLLLVCVTCLYIYMVSEILELDPSIHSDERDNTM